MIIAAYRARLVVPMSFFFMLMTCVTVNAQERTWTSLSGQFTVKAEYAGAIGNSVRLRKSSGEVITVPIAQLSVADQQHVAEERKRRRDAMPSGQLSLAAWQLYESAIFLAAFDNDRQGDVSTKKLAMETKGALLAPGKIGNGMQFDATDDYIEIAGLYPLLREGLSELSVSLWLAQPKRKKTSMLFDAGFYGDSISLTVDAKQCRFIIPTKVGGQPLAFKLPNDTDWHHVVATWNGSRQIVYVNGKQVASGKTRSTGTLSNKTLGGPHVVRLGSQTKPADQKGRFFGGSLDEVGVFNKALTATQVMHLYRLGGKGESLASLVSQDSAGVVAGSKIQIRKLDALKIHEGIQALAFSKDGKHLASSDPFKGVKVTDLKTKKVTHEKKIEQIVALAFSPDSDALVMASDRTMIWNLRTDRTKYLSRDDKAGHATPTVRWLDNGSIFYGYGYGILPWDKAGDAFGKLELEDFVVAWNISDDGSLIAAGMKGDGDRYFIALVDYESREVVTRFPLDGTVGSIAISSDKQYMAVGMGYTSSGKIHIYDLNKKALVGSMSGSEEHVEDLEFIPNSHAVVACRSFPGIVRIWDAETQKKLAESLTKDEIGTECLAISADGKTLAVGLSIGFVELWSLR